MQEKVSDGEKKVSQFMGSDKILIKFTQHFSGVSGQLSNQCAARHRQGLVMYTKEFTVSSAFRIFMALKKL